mmetsp:Transcript_31890/g.75899  ORF Transcript_31890/g.75899 Transcript_31890/m.75899 type:complete len:350 (+) Transcript_31890:75-1124(+)|eukprot:CAMPEP_0181448894 /NCGR_PEP_ID=MMETSP1110-20121109/27373_1 /TAXON_ID=174948 /ORGANISM="Symbiodinium sp., Strain CCMP421" /LENGTH=349 /DNA_ID=CAMNT_0023573053 /DNA_START=5 /DNA_END=1054 /DNA_ORIENTATION=+
MSGRANHGDGKNRAGASKNPSGNGPSARTAAKLASLDWPPPPSPASIRGWESLDRGLGATSPTFDQDEGFGKTSRAAELHNRKELWDVRAEIDKEKLRHVAPFPFFGRAMRFQDEFAALQITDDGRFSYSFVGLNYEVEGEQPSGEDPKSRVLTYEGVLITPKEEVPLDEEPEAEGSARIEGLAMAKHEIEEVGGRARLVSISRSSSRFAIVVSPYFQPSMAVVYSLHLAMSPRRPRRTQLPYVGRGMKRELQAAMRTGDVWRSCQERRRAPKPKFSKSGSTSMLPAAAPRKKDGEERACSRLTATSSMPQLPQLVDTKKKDRGGAKEPTSVSDWREFYKQRAQDLLGS